jgi:hypothetical protein
MAMTMMGDIQLHANRTLGRVTWVEEMSVEELCLSEPSLGFLDHGHHSPFCFLHLQFAPRMLISVLGGVMTTKRTAQRNAPSPWPRAWHDSGGYNENVL